MVNYRLWTLALPVLAVLAGCENQPREALGTLEWDLVNGRAVSSMPIVEVFVREGDDVAAGAPLLQLDPSLQQAQVARLEARVAETEWQVKLRKTGYREEEITSARGALQAAVEKRDTLQLEFERQKSLLKDNATSRRTYEQVENQLSEAEAQRIEAFENLERLETGFRIEEIRQAEARFEAARAELAHGKRELERYTVVAERKGRVDSLPFRLGDKPPRDAVVSTLVAGEAPWARVYLPEPWLSTVKVGDEVSVYVDGRAQPFAGRIRFIASQASFTPYYGLSEQDRKRLSFVTEIDLIDEAARQLPLGIPVRMERLGG